jgi:uncharacterized protein YkwD
MRPTPCWHWPGRCRRHRLRLRNECTVAAAALIALACVSPASAPRRATDGGDPRLDLAAAVVELVDAHNRIRAEHHLASLTPSGPLEAAAREHARDMARWHVMAHRGSDLSSPFRRMARQGYAFRRAGENVAAGYRSVDAVMSGWMRSLGHRRNILGRFSEIGAACATATDGTPYWCVTFGEPSGP